MNVFGWAANLLSQSPALQPSGGIDVVAIKHADGTLSCSPFHVKLGKTCKKGEKRLVRLRVNGNEVDVCMRLGPAGEAFFLKRIKEVPPREREYDPSFNADLGDHSQTKTASVAMDEQATAIATLSRDPQDEQETAR